MDKFIAIIVVFAIICLNTILWTMDSYININTKQITELKTEITKLQSENNTLIDFMNTDKVKHMINQYDSIDLQMSQFQRNLLEKGTDIELIKRTKGIVRQDNEQHEYNGKTK